MAHGAINVPTPKNIYSSGLKKSLFAVTEDKKLGSVGIFFCIPT